MGYGSFGAKFLPKSGYDAILKRSAIPFWLALPTLLTPLAEGVAPTPLAPLTPLFSVSPLAGRAKMRSAPRQLNAPDGRLALPARLTRALVDTMFELKEAPLSVRIHIV